MKKLLVFGSGTLGRTCADCAVKMGYADVEFLDDNTGEKSVMGFPVSGGFADAEKYDAESTALFVALDDNPTRLSLVEKYASLGYEIVSLIHPEATVSPFVSIDDGVLIASGTVVNAGTEIGTAAILDSGVRIDRGCEVGKGVSVSNGAVLCANVTVGDLSTICAGSVIANDTNIGAHCVVAEGAAVIKDAPDYSLAAGVPAVIRRDLRPTEEQK